LGAGLATSAKHGTTTPDDCQEESNRSSAELIKVNPSAITGPRSWLRNYIKPKWAERSFDQIKPLAVEGWLKRLSLAPKSKSHLKNLMRVLFNAAMRWEFIPSTQSHEPRARKRRFETKTRAKISFGRRISADVGTHPRAIFSGVTAKPAMGGNFKSGHMARDVILFTPLSRDQASPFGFSNSSAHI
jgi:hypothetical protein